MRFPQILCALIAGTLTAIAQPQAYPVKKSPLSDTDLKRWSHLDPVKDTVPGMSVDRAYKELLKSPGEKVIVGVIDSGFDVEHEDLKSVLWTNSKEIDGNGIDDDGNGYADDIHGWNFLGDVLYETLEVTRLVRKGDDGSEAYKIAKADFDKQLLEAQTDREGFAPILAAHDEISAFLGKKNYTLEEVREITPNEKASIVSIRIMMAIIRRAGPEFHVEIDELRRQNDAQLLYNLNLEYDGRKKFLGDNHEDFSTKFYGNPNVGGKDPDLAVHGTHVAGIIGAVRNNGKGGDGIADNVAIMTIRAVPKGDEYDKDIALAIRYAVDNGAKIINASFGKSYSPQKEWVYDAIKYAALKDVLIVHAAGNDGLDIDLPQNRNFPNDSDDLVKEFANNVLTVGALGPDMGAGVVAPFSNYGIRNVDVFAPGMQIYATVPDGYEFQQGTSMAAPNVTGVAALIRSRYPKLTAIEVKKIIMDSGTSLTHEVELGEEKEKRPFSKSCSSGRIVNAYNALKMATKIAKK
jgi:cell wall-associated protease